MTSVFVRYFERDSPKPTCILLHDEQAVEFLEDPREYVMCEFDEGRLDGFWVVPERLENVTASGNLYHAFCAVVGLDALTDEPRVSDLLATIFEAGCMLTNQLKT